MVEPQVKVKSKSAEVGVEGTLDLPDSVMSEDISFGGSLRVSPDLERALREQSGELGELRDVSYTFNTGVDGCEVSIKDGKININFGSDLSLISSDDRILASTDGEGMMLTELSREIEERFGATVNYNVRYDPEARSLIGAGVEIKGDRVTTRYILSGDEQEFTLAIVDPKKNFFCSLVCTVTEDGTAGAEKTFELKIRQDGREVQVAIDPEDNAYRLLGRFQMGENFERSAGFTITDREIEGIMGISYTHRRLGAVDFDVTAGQDSIGCTLNIDLGRYLKLK